ncbi:MAG: 2-dehydropantoate 2-reductase [Solirubrobacteraceae bacterium]
MRVAVLGAGAIGAYVGAALARGGADVHLIARGAHLEAMRTDGVRVLSDRGDFTVSVPATDDPAEVGAVDVVFLGIKAYGYADAGPLLAPLLAEHTAVVAAQNGVPWWYFHGAGGHFEGRRIEAVDPGGSVSAVISPERAIGCVVYSSTAIEGPGVIRHYEGTRFSVGEPDRSISQRCVAFAEAMKAGGLKCPVESGLRADIWIKLMGNAVFNPLSVVTRATMEQMCGHGGTRDLARGVMEEIVAVAGALGEVVDVSIDRRIAGAERVGAHKTSMLQDYEAGKRLELDAIVAAVVELAELVGVDAPRLRDLHATTDLLARSTTEGTNARHADQDDVRPSI